MYVLELDGTESYLDEVHMVVNQTLFDMQRNLSPWWLRKQGRFALRIVATNIRHQVLELLNRFLNLNVLVTLLANADGFARTYEIARNINLLANY